MYQRQYQENTHNLAKICKNSINIASQINRFLNDRKKVTDIHTNTILNSKPQISQQYNREISAHFNKYSNIKRFVKDFIHNPNFFKSLADQNNGFWEINERTQRDLQKKLKSLKQIDNEMDILITDQIQLANNIQQIQEQIRAILLSKGSQSTKHEYTMHIQKAEPLYIQKQQLFHNLQSVKQKKQQAKAKKLQQIKFILEILYQMKVLRQKRLNQCKQINLDKQGISLIQCFTQDLQEVIQNRGNLNNFQNNYKKTVVSLNQINNHISKLIRQLTQAFEVQNNTFNTINQIFKQKSQNSYFQQKLFAYFDIPQQQIFKINENILKYIDNESHKSTQLSQILQGIETTEDTIQIFQNLRNNIQTQTIRKRQLTQKISKLSQFHVSQKERRQAISQKQGQIQTLQINLSKLQKMLQQAAQQADVKQYKLVSVELKQIQRQMVKEHGQLDILKKEKRDAAKRIFLQTNHIQEQYRDLILQMLPQIWFRDQDFNKEQTIYDLDMYLGKLFSRLKILG